MTGRRGWRYFDVSLDEQGATRVERKPLSERDREHLS